VIKVERKGMRGPHSYDRIGYYISSLLPSSAVLAAGIPGHWLIENSLHWVLTLSPPALSTGLTGDSCFKERPYLKLFPTLKRGTSLPKR
jgi:hypothetical protein